MEKTEVFRRVVADKVKHYLCETLTECDRLTGEGYRRRVEQVKALLTPAEWDEVAINRASMGFCGWLCCATPPGTHARRLGLLNVMLQATIDRDVIDSFHSTDCLNAFRLIRSQLDTTVSQLRHVPHALAQDFLENRLPTSNLRVLAKKAGLDDDSLVKEIASISLADKPPTRQLSAGSLTAEDSSPTGASRDTTDASKSFADKREASSGEPKKSSLAKPKTHPIKQKKVSFSDNVQLSHAPRRRDVAGSDDWKSLSRRQAIMLSFLSSAQVDHINYEEDHKLRCFNSLDELYDLPCDADGYLLYEDDGNDEDLVAYDDEEPFVPYDDN